MAARTLEDRVTAVEGTVAGLHELPKQVASLEGAVTTLQGAVTTLQGDVTSLRGDLTSLRGDLTSLQGDVATFRREVAARFEQVDVRFERLERIVRDGDERNYSQMRMLHEELVAKIAVLGERRNGPDQRPRRPKR